MHSNGVLQMTDTRRLSPQTTSSSGYHSDLSSTNESPQLTHNNELSVIEQKKTVTNKNLSRISSFIRKQYDRAKSKLIPQKQTLPPITTCSKSTSTTPQSAVSENHYTKPQQSSSSTYKQSSFIEPIYSIYVQPLHDSQVKIPFTTSIHQCHSHQPSHHIFCNSTTNNNQVNSYRRLAAIANHKNTSTHSYSTKPTVYQSYYPYKYIEKNYNDNRLTYAPLSDFISATNSAFKPVKASQRPVCRTLDQIPLSDDPCDLEVAQYFHQTPRWNNRNYFDIYSKEVPTIFPKQNFTGTLC